MLILFELINYIFALIFKTLLDHIVYTNQYVDIIGIIRSQFLKHLKKYFLTKSKTENMLSPDLLGLNVEIG